MLWKIIQADSYIQYLLELDTSGYVEPSNPRVDLTYLEKQRLMRSHRLRWNYPEGISPDVYELQTGEDIFPWAYVGGVYARGIRIPDSTPLTTRQLYFYQFPSSNRRVEYEQWVISDLGLDICNFAIDPEQNLLVLLEPFDVRQDKWIYRLHLRSITTNEIHPKAPSSYSFLVYEYPTRLVPGNLFHIEISGRLLAVLFHSRNRYVPSYLVIWDWITGTELTVS